jgi:hypothetical protein
VPASSGVSAGESVPGEASVRTRPALLAGLVGGLVGATCCIGPAVGVALGAGTGSFLLSMGRYRPITFALGALVAFVVSAGLLSRRRASCATTAQYRRLRSRWVDVAMVAFAATYALGRFAGPPILERFL